MDVVLTVLPARPISASTTPAEEGGPPPDLVGSIEITEQAGTEQLGSDGFPELRPASYVIPINCGS